MFQYLWLGVTVFFSFLRNKAPFGSKSGNRRYPGHVRERCLLLYMLNWHILCHLETNMLVMSLLAGLYKSEMK